MKRAWPYGALLAGVVLLIGGLLGLALNKPPRDPTAQTAQLPAPITIISPQPGASPELGTMYRVKLPELGIDLPVVGGDGHTVPLFRAATEPNMKLPGEGGRSLIYAHARPGMFGSLFNVQVGNKVEVDRPGAPALHYVVRSFTKRWPATDYSILKPADHEELVLMTCTTYDPRDPRIVAIATPA